MRRPAERIAHQRDRADDLAVLLGEQAVDPAVVDRRQPRLDDARVFEIAAEEQQVMLGQVLREGDHRVAVGAAETSDALAHIDRSASQFASAGHMRLIALPPATRLTCPPFSMISCLSGDPIIPSSGADASRGTI